MDNLNLTAKNEPSLVKPKGLILKEAREKKGLSLEVVHEATKIPMDALRAIEQGYAVRNLSPFYLRGFIKIYAHFLNIDPKSILEDFHKEELPKYVPLKSSGLDIEFIQQWVSRIISRIERKHIIIFVSILIAFFLRICLRLVLSLS